jgi:hypothetical protein
VKVKEPVWWGALAAMASGVMLIVADLLRIYISDIASEGTISIFFLFEGWIGVVLAVVVQLGLFGIYAPRARALGVIGLLGLVLVSLGVELTMGSSFIFPFDRPPVWPWQDATYFEEPLSAILMLGFSFVLGCVLLGVAMLRARVYSRAAAMLFIVGALILLTPLALNDVVFAAGLIWLGHEIFAGRSEEVRGLRTHEPRFEDT